jgi:hypothetical protein
MERGLRRAQGYCAVLTRACTVVAPARVPGEGGSTQRRGGSKADRTAAGSGAVPAILSVLGVAVVGAIVGGAVGTGVGTGVGVGVDGVVGDGDGGGVGGFGGGVGVCVVGMCVVGVCVGSGVGVGAEP